MIMNFRFNKGVRFSKDFKNLVKPYHIKTIKSKGGFLCVSFLRF